MQWRLVGLWLALLERKHPDLYHKLSKQQFAQDAERLRREIPRLDDGVYIRDADTSIAHLIGARIVAVNGRSIDSVLTQLSSFVAYENEAQLTYALPSQMTLVEVLQYAGLVTRTDSVRGTATSYV